MAEVNYDAEGLDEDTGNMYGISVSELSESSEYYSFGDNVYDASGLHIVMKSELLRTNWEEGRWPYSYHDVYRWDLYVFGTLIGLREEFSQRLEDNVLIGLAARNAATRLIFDHPTRTREFTRLHVRMETIYDGREYLEEEDEDEDEDEEEAIIYDDEYDHCRLTPASREAVEALERVAIGDGTRETSCAVCLEDLSAGGCEATMMPCSHLFHGDCILSWLKYQSVCPLCRFELPR